MKTTMRKIITCIALAVPAIVILTAAIGLAYIWVVSNTYLNPWTLEIT